jgi:hypothetical protein
MTPSETSSEKTYFDRLTLKPLGLYAICEFAILQPIHNHSIWCIDN